LTLICKKCLNITAREYYLLGFYKKTTFGDQMIIKDTKTLGKFIRETRKSQNLTQAMLAGASGVGVRFLIELENGKETASLGKTIRILNMLGVNIDLGKA